MWKIPLFDVSFDELEIKATEKIISLGWLTMGEVTQKFEEAFSGYIGAKHAIAVSNCTAALHLANLALDIGPGDEVLCPSLTFVAGANSILYTGARPVFADVVSEENLCICPSDIRKKITAKTKAIQVMHYAGYPCDMQAINEIAAEHRLHVIEDCAHSPGAEFQGKKCGTFGDIGCFSFFSNKNMTTGEGGMVVTNDDRLAEKIRLMRSHGMTTLTLDRAKGHAFSYDVVDLGYNYRIDEIRSAMGLIQLEKLEDFNTKRQKIVHHYIDQLSALNNIGIPFVHREERSSYHIFPVILSGDTNRERFMEFLKADGIQTSIHYPPVHQFQYYRQLLGAKHDVELTEKISTRLVTLPLYPAMSEQEVGTVVTTIKKFFNKSGELP